MSKQPVYLPFTQYRVLRPSGGALVGKIIQGPTPPSPPGPIDPIGVLASVLALDHERSRYVVELTYSIRDVRELIVTEDLGFRVDSLEVAVASTQWSQDGVADRHIVAKQRLPYTAGTPIAASGTAFAVVPLVREFNHVSRRWTIVIRGVGYPPDVSATQPEVVDLAYILFALPLDTPNADRVTV